MVLKPSTKRIILSYHKYKSFQLQKDFISIGHLQIKRRSKYLHWMRYTRHTTKQLYQKLSWLIIKKLSGSGFIMFMGIDMLCNKWLYIFQKQKGSQSKRNTLNIKEVVLVSVIAKHGTYKQRIIISEGKNKNKIPVLAFSSKLEMLLPSSTKI